jgi:serpin B
MVVALGLRLLGARRDGRGDRAGGRAGGAVPASVVAADAIFAAPGLRLHPLLPAPVERLDFGDLAAARRRLDAWIAEATRGFITTTAAPLRADTVLLLMTAIYLKVKWETPFQPALTAEAPFRGEAGEEVTVRMMGQTARFRYARLDGVQLVELPYADGELAMVIILPERIDGLADVEASLTPERLDGWLLALQHEKVDVSLPRFEAATTLDLSRTLPTLGVRRAFGPGADFSGLADEPLYVTATATQARIVVDEEGTEAAAEMAFAVGRGRALPPKHFRADHPFLYLIRSNATGELLFIGRVASPAHKT